MLCTDRKNVVLFLHVRDLIITFMVILYHCTPTTSLLLQFFSSLVSPKTTPADATRRKEVFVPILWNVLLFRLRNLSIKNRPIKEEAIRNLLPNLGESLYIMTINITSIIDKNADTLYNKLILLSHLGLTLRPRVLSAKLRAKTTALVLLRLPEKQNIKENQFRVPQKLLPCIASANPTKIRTNSRVS